MKKKNGSIVKENPKHISITDGYFTLEIRGKKNGR